MKPSKFKSQALSLNFTAEAAYKYGLQVEFSILGILDGPDKGSWGITGQVNGLLGLEGGLTGSMSVYAPIENDMNLSLNDFIGTEIGLQLDWHHIGGSIFRGVNFRNDYPFLFYNYKGFSVGLTGGVVQLLANGSGYIGLSGFLLRFDK